MRVHFKGWSSKWDEIVNINSENIDVKYAEIGLYSKAYGLAKFHRDAIIGDQKHELELSESHYSDQKKLKSSSDIELREKYL